MDATPVTRGEYLSFVCRHPQWRKSAVKPLFAERSYLRDWTSDLEPGGRLTDPVTNISWFAARAYCAARKARLPTIAEWERVAGAEQPQSEVSGHEPYHGEPFRFAMGSVAADLRGAALQFGAVWEWSEDFNSAVTSGRAGSRTLSSLFCGDGYRANNARDYGAFLRYTFRSSLRAGYTLKNLGFRCVEEEA
jgi:formylglycine-generating enzyme required for sulfatase activity